MVEHYRKFQYWDDKPKITIFWEDAKVYIHDGHHRCLAMILAGHTYLLDDEFNQDYMLTEFRYTDYARINIKRGFLTPFDPRTETRLPDFKQYKEEFAQKFSQIAFAPNPEEIMQGWAIANKMKYAKPRHIYTLEELKRKYETDIQKNS